jgi:hypothetical protein
MSAMSTVRPLVLLMVLVISCTTAAPPPPSETPVVAASPVPTDTPAPTPTPKPLPAKGRSVSVVGNTVVATGDFRGTRDSEIALLEDPLQDLGLRISLRDSFGATASALWLQTDRNFLSLARAHFAVADVDFDGKDDLVALYNSGANTSKLFVFRSTGSTFAFGGAWWTGDLTWSRARDLLAGKLSASGHDTLLVPFQDDEARMRVLAFESTGSKLSAPATVYDSGKGQFDLSKTRFAVGRFTRATGADQLVVFAQSKTRALARVLDPTEKGLALGIDILTDVDYDVTRASLRAADVLGTGHDELVSLYTDDKGGAKVQVFDLSSAPVSFLTPLRGWDGWATLGPGSVCGGPGALATGDWDKDGRADLAALAPAIGAVVRAQVMTSSGTALAASITNDPGLLCPVWPLTGLPLGFGDATKRPLYVKTDNNPTARPHFGISQADVVYEWLVEGFTTRLAAVYQSRQPDVIGSVRSVRMTDRHVLPSLDAVLVYTGGGPEELMAINYDAAVAHRYIDLSPNYGWGYRVPFRPAPYNYFTTYAQLRAAIAAAPDADQPALVAPWRFLPTATGDPLLGGFAASVPASAIAIPYRAGFGVAYTYDPTTRTYVRFDDGDREVDAANNVAIAARNIVVIQTEVHLTDAFGLDPAGNPKLEEVLTGTGKAVVFRDGRRVDATWTRADIIDQFILRDGSGQVIFLSPGQTWVHVVPNDWTIASQ